MKKLLKVILYSVLTLLVLLIVAIIVLPRLINPNDYKVDIADLVQKHTGRELSIDGDIRLSVFPWLGFEIGAAQLHNPAEFKESTFIKIDSAKAKVRLLSFFSDELEIGQLELLGLQLHLQRTASGNNWSDLLTHNDAATPAPAPTDSPPRLAKRLRIEGIVIRDAAIHWDDQLARQQIKLTPINLSAGPLSQQHLPLQLDVAFTLPSQELSGHLALQTMLNLDLDKQHFVFSDLELVLDAQGKQLPESPLSVQLRVPTLILDTPAQQLELQAFTLLSKPHHITGQLKLTHWDKPQIRFDLDSGKFDLNRFLPEPANRTPTPVATRAPSQKSAAPLLPASLDLQGTLRIEELRVRDYQASKIQIPLTIKNGKARLQPVMHLYGGELEGDWQINTQTQPLRWQLQNSLRGIELGPLVQAVSGKDHVRGKAEIDARLTTEGLEVAGMLQHLNGEATLRVAQPQLVNMDLHNWLFGKWYDKLKLTRPAEEKKHVTVFDELRASFRIRQGVIDNQDLLATSERNHLTGTGQINLIKQDIDYTVHYIPKTSYVISINDHDYDLKDEPLPITIRGAWAGPPEVDPEIEEVAKRIQKRSLQRKVEAEKTTLKRQVEQEFEESKDKLLKKLLKK